MLQREILHSIVIIVILFALQHVLVRTAQQHVLLYVLMFVMANVFKVVNRHVLYLVQSHARVVVKATVLL